MLLPSRVVFSFYLFILVDCNKDEVVYKFQEFFYKGNSKNVSLNRNKEKP